EMFQGPGKARAGADLLVQKITTMPDGELVRRQQSAERALLNLGITFRVYGDAEGTERIFPFDLVPRIIEADEWKRIEEGLKQRVLALNHFLNDLYGEQRIVKDGVIPEEIIKSAASF